MTELVGIKWLMNETGMKSHATLKKNILIPFREELEGFVRYPNNPGEPWKIGRARMKNWLENNGGRIGKENHTSKLSQIDIDKKIALSQIQEICIKQMQLADLTGNFARINALKEINVIAEREIKR